jgi:K+-sensing histidine kinase KdpD
MRLSKRLVPVSGSLAIIAAVTAVLLYFKDDDPSTDQHLVFFYLLPTAFVAILYGSVVSMVCAIAATFAAAFFLYDPIFSFYVSSPREVGELFFCWYRFDRSEVHGGRDTPARKPGDTTTAKLLRK